MTQKRTLVDGVMKAAFERARAALDFLEVHQLEPSPPHYEFALTVVSEPKSVLAKAVADHTDGGLRLTAATVKTLLSGHCQAAAAPPVVASGVSMVAAHEQTVARHAQELGSLTSDAHQLTENLGRDVGSMVDRAENWPGDAGNFVTRLSSAEQDLADLRKEIARLRDNMRAPPYPAQPVGAGTYPAHHAPSGFGTLARDDDRDDLTHALSRSGARELMQQVAQGGRSHVIMMFTVDDLETINDRYGRAVGDNVLNAFAATLQQTFDTEELIRWSGNEFVFIGRDITMDRARVRTEEALAAFAVRRLRLRGTGEWIGTITGSAGLAYGQSGEQEEVLTHARTLAQRAAAAGGNRYEM